MPAGRGRVPFAAGLTAGKMNHGGTECTEKDAAWSPLPEASRTPSLSSLCLCALGGPLPGSVPRAPLRRKEDHHQGTKTQRSRISSSCPPCLHGESFLSCVLDPP